MKRRSSTSARRELRLKYFADRNLGLEFVEILQHGGLDVEAHDDHFPQRTDDEDWINLCAKKGWVAFSTDKSIARNYPEIRAVMTQGVEMFVPEGTKKLPSEFAHLILRTQGRIHNHIRKKRKWNQEPFISKIGYDLRDKTKPGRVFSWMTLENWKEKTNKRRGK